MFKYFLLINFLALCSYTQTQILIITHAFNRPDFIEIQHKTFKKFFLDEYEFVVFSDAKTEEMHQKINNTCVQLGIRCIRIPQEIHDRPYLDRLWDETYQTTSARISNAFQYSLDTLGFDHDDIVIVIDSDMFLVKPLSARKFLNGYSLGAVQQIKGHVNYIWNGLVFFDMRTLPNKRTLNFNYGVIDGHLTDTGGYTFFYLRNNPQVSIRHINQQYVGWFLCDECNRTQQSNCTHNTETLLAAGFDANQIQFAQIDRDLEFLIDNSILHYRSGSNWNNKDSEYHQRKTNALNVYLTAILK